MLVGGQKPLLGYRLEFEVTITNVTQMIWCVCKYKIKILSKCTIMGLTLAE